MKQHRSKYNDPRWKARSKEIKIRDEYYCQLCNRTHKLHVHHITYVQGWELWEYPDEYLITLCMWCHLGEHACLLLIDKGRYLEAMLSGLTATDIFQKILKKESKKVFKLLKI